MSHSLKAWLLYQEGRPTVCVPKCPLRITSRGVGICVYDCMNSHHLEVRPKCGKKEFINQNCQIK